MKTHIVVSWVMTPCGVVVEYQDFGGTYLPYCLLRSCETLVRIYHVTRCHKLEDHNESRYSFSLDNLSLLSVLKCLSIYYTVHTETSGDKKFCERDSIMKNAIFWDVVPCRSCNNRRFGGTCRPHIQDRKIPRAKNSRSFYSEVGGETFLRNVDSHKTYTAPHPWTRRSSQSPPRKTSNHTWY
jgi:hypothetical protein